MSLDFLDGFSSDYENALVQCGFGKFHFLLLAVCGLIYLNTAISVTILSFVLPSANCDFQMSSEDKGWLSASPMLGMLLGSYFWGSLADIKGRKMVLITTLILDGICGILSSFVPYFIVFVGLRFFNGFNIAGAMGIVFPYLGEFQPTKYREKILCWMELFWTVGIIVLPTIAWTIIPLKKVFASGAFMYKSWNLFVAICAIPSIILGLWLYWFPESPKFLVEHGQTEKALDILEKIFAKNTGRKPEEYPIKSLIEASREREIETDSFQNNVPNKGGIKRLLKRIWTQTKTLFHEPYLKNTTLTCSIQFCLTMSYYTLMVWFPELFQRFEIYEIQHPDQTSSVCDVAFIRSNTTTVECSQTVDKKVYIHTIIIGLACIPGSFLLPLCVHRLGVKFFLVFSLISAGVVTIGFFFVRSSYENLILSCIFEALTSLSISTVYCVMVDLFPTSLRVMAAALSMTFGRTGALLGNLVFGFLIDLNCFIPLALFSTLLFVSGVLCWMLPETGTASLD